MYLSYSGFDYWDSCPYSYWHRYVVKTRPPKPDNRVNMLYGATVGMSFEHFYNQKMWRLPNFVDVMLGKVRQLVEKIMEDETAEGKNGIINWKDKEANYSSIEEVVEDVQGAIRRGIKIIKHHRLVGYEAVSEMKLDVRTEGHTLGGRTDFLIRRLPPLGDMTITDGKGSRFRDRYVDRRQLRWYAMLFEYLRKCLPDQVGFIYWRSDPETAIDWYPVTPSETAELRKAVFEAIDAIEDRRRRLPVAPEPTRDEILSAFPARPSKDCRWCNYLSACEDGQRYMSNIGKAPAPISEDGPDASGVEDVGL